MPPANEAERRSKAPHLRAFPFGGGTRVWPDLDQSLLLRAALEPGVDGHMAFARWCRRRARVDACVDYPSDRLLPLVFSNLAQTQPRFPHADHLRALYRLSWARSERQRRGAAQGIRILQRAGIPVMVSKGCALATDFYRTPAERPSHDCDIHVPEQHLGDALAALIDAGWVAHKVQHALPARDWTMLAFGMAMRHPDHGEIDLHGRLFRDSRDPAIEAAVWRNAVRCEIKGVEILRPSTTHLLLHVMTNGIKPDHVATLQWVTDAAVILELGEGQIDWAAFWALAVQTQVMARVCAGLNFLQVLLPGRPLPSPIRPSPHLVEWLESRALRQQDEAEAATATRLFALAAIVRRYQMADWTDRARWLKSDLGKITDRAWQRYCSR